MNDRQNENASRIAAYLGNRLSPEEREAFKRLLSEDDELRVQYVDALMNRAAKEPAAVEAEPEKAVSDVVPELEVSEVVPEPEVSHVMPVPEVSQVVPEPQVSEVVPEPEVGEGTWETLGEQGAREAWEAGWQGGKKRAGVGFLGSGWIVAITVLLLIIGAAVIFIMNRHEQYWDKTVAAMTSNSGNVDKVVPDSATAATTDRRAATPVSKVDAATKGAALKGGLMDSLYAELYKPYMRGDDPVEVREYYQDYKAGNYAAVLAAGDSMVMKISPQRLLVRDYMRLYLGLSYLASGDGQNAVRELEGVVLRTKPGDVLYEAARWYLALAWLKRNDVDPTEARGKAIGLARDISHSYSRYQGPARELMKALGS
jgi:hypothetical protein